MAFGFLNALMLLGLGAIALPVVAHLISKRRFDVVDWGAMRFLELGQRTRRRIRLQDLLLLLLRMTLLACLALALSRPWGSGSLWGAFGPELEHDYVFIIDGSTSTAWHDGEQTAHQAMSQWLFDALETLNPGDTVGVIDARNQPKRLVAPLTTDRKRVRDQLAKIAEPAGTSRLPEAIEDALRMLATATHVSRRIIVLSDDQSQAWRPEDNLAWARIEELRKQPQVFPAIDIVTFGPDQARRDNLSVGRIELSREVTVPEFPIKIRTKIRQSGGKERVRRAVSLLIDHQLLPEKTIEVDVLPDGESTVEFDHAFSARGKFLATVSIEPDRLPNDDRADAVIAIETGIPVLLVDGDPRVDQIRSETFYLQSVFAASGTRFPWIQATVTRPAELDEAALKSQQVIFLCNVPELTQRQWDLIRRFVRDGGGVVIAPGDHVEPAAWNSADEKEKIPFLPRKFLDIQHPEAATADAEVTIHSPSLEVGWLQRFRQENGVDLTQTRIQKWWTFQNEPESESPPPETSPTASGKLPKTTSEPTRLLARLSNGQPLLLSRQYGYGTVLELAVPLDADWSTLPAKNDFVPFLYEMVFTLTSTGNRRNVDVGAPLLLPLQGSQSAQDFIVNGPGFENQPAQSTQRGRRAFAEFEQTTVPGIYQFENRQQRQSNPELFVVDDDHRESDLTPMTAENWQTLLDQKEVQRRESMQNIIAATAKDAPRAELWWLLLVVVLVLLVSEAALTRKMVQGGHAAIDEVLMAETA